MERFIRNAYLFCRKFKIVFIFYHSIYYLIDIIRDIPHCIVFAGSILKRSSTIYKRSLQISTNSPFGYLIYRNSICFHESVTVFAFYPIFYIFINITLKVFNKSIAI